MSGAKVRPRYKTEGMSFVLVELIFITSRARGSPAVSASDREVSWPPPPPAPRRDLVSPPGSCSRPDRAQVSKRGTNSARAVAPPRFNAT